MEDKFPKRGMLPERCMVSFGIVISESKFVKLLADTTGGDEHVP